LQFDPESQKFHCEYCLSDFTELEMKAPEKEDGAMVYNCPNCGAQIVTDETTAATFCYYCHSPVVLSGRLAGDFRPELVVPFEIDREKALEIFRQWISRKKYIPKAFYSEEQIEKLSGVYFPYWLYRCRVESKLDAAATKISSWTTGSIRYTRTEKYDVSREGQMPVENVPRNALSKANRQLVESVLPYEMEKAQPFQMGYLSGFMAEKRDMEQEAFAGEVEAEVRGYAEDSLKSQLAGYQSVDIRTKETRIEDPEWSYALLPVWTLTYRDEKHDKLYYFACNGQTGKICGELPVDSGRLARLFVSIAAPMFAVLLAVAYFIL